MSFIFVHIGMKLFRGMCKYIRDILPKGIIIWFDGSTGNEIVKAGWLLFGLQV
jgi:hypothetical protein